MAFVISNKSDYLSKGIDEIGVIVNEK